MRKFTGLFLYATFSVCLAAQSLVPLGTAGNFGVLAGSTVTNTGATAVGGFSGGQVGVSPGTAVTGFPPGTASAIHAGDATAATAQVDLTAAYNNAAGQLSTGVLAGNIGGTTIVPGVYTNASSVGITGNVTLSGAGVYVFQIGSTLTTASGSQVILAGGATADNVFWQVSTSATLGTGSLFNGNILALSSITVTTGATLNGRALARNGAVTLDTNGVTVPAPAATPTPTPTLPPGTPAPSSAILVTIGLVCVGLYEARRRFRRSGSA
jgi:hypothetical protein